ncbi:TPA: cell division protein FtsK [Streptococcus suis]|uniref:FtsK/SpoIIIE domain-containing protein n=1 Tax=Streptococcus suis TaxID=1307 RepID=UPI0005CE4464|nr:FtsK/SpoIIIE domain-containing protein [Streptococcus suis]MCK3870770.1 cell division protein FtsK [Streptococcus suis]NQH20942.1 cell division protein FtsK [Streptococcus suis]HEM4403515.1 cell division protein FtsK [Streptococcus suis]
MNNRNYKMITAFTKPPILLREKYFQIIMLGLILILIWQSIMKSDYLIMTLFLATIVFLCVGYVFYKYKASLDYKIKEFILHNSLYGSDISAEVGYLVTDEKILIRFKKNADLFTDKASQFTNHFQAMLDLPLQDIENNKTYCDYIFDRYPDKRLEFFSRKVSNNIIKLTEKISWEFSKPCHTLICGSTNSGKTYLATMLILDYLMIKGKGGGCDIYVCDPKSADLSYICRRIDLKKYGRVQNLAVSDNEIARLLREVSAEMERRYSEWFTDDEHSFGKTWKDIDNAKPLVVIIDEFSAVLSVANSKVAKEITEYFNNLLLKGRMVGIEIVLIMQRPDISSNSNNGLTGQQRDQFGVRIGMGNMTIDGRRMLFGNTDTEFQTVKEIGAGYILIDGKHTKPVYFEAPLLPENKADFLEYADKMILLNMV